VPFLVLAALGLPLLGMAAWTMPPLTGHLGGTRRRPLAQLLDTLTYPSHRPALALTAILMFGAFSVIPYISASSVSNAGVTEALLPVVFFAILFGVALTAVGDAGRDIADLLVRLQAVFFRIVDAAPGAVAVHCLAGLGRTGTLIALYMMRTHGFTARAAMGWLRLMRPGSVIGEQQDFLCTVQRIREITPLIDRIANRLLRRVRDYAEVKTDGRISKAVAEAALAMLDVDAQGFDLMDRKLLEAVIHRFDGGPVGLDNIAASIGEERDTIEDVIEPFLIQQGFLQRTPRGWRSCGT
jgi:hypothetical protein